MTDHEIALQRRAARLVSQEVQCCMSSLVATLAKAQGSRWRVLEEEEIYGLTCQAFELAAHVLDYESAAREAGWTWVADDERFASSAGEFFAPMAGCDWQRLGDEHDIEPQYLEVYEHWAVSTWLAEKLTAKGERVDTDFAGLNVWARTTTGQAISMDSVIEAITSETGYASGGEA